MLLSVIISVKRLCTNIKKCSNLKILKYVLFIFTGNLEKEVQVNKNFKN